jgi:hypothetical protein
LKRFTYMSIGISPGFLTAPVCLASVSVIASGQAGT